MKCNGHERDTGNALFDYADMDDAQVEPIHSDLLRSKGFSPGKANCLVMSKSAHFRMRTSTKRWKKSSAPLRSALRAVKARSISRVYLTTWMSIPQNWAIPSPGAMRNWLN